MKKHNNPYQMTLSQFLLFLVIGGVAMIWLGFEIGAHLRYGEPLYPVDNYIHLKSELISNTEILIPEEVALPSGDYINFYACESTRRKLDPRRDGYVIGIIEQNLGYSIACSPVSNPIHVDSVPEEIRPDYLFNGIPVMCSDVDFPQLEFVRSGYYYYLTAWGTEIPDDALEILLAVTDNILQQVE